MMMQRLWFALLCAASLAAANAQTLEVEKLGNAVNSEYDEITPVVSWDGKTLFFTRCGHPGFERTLVEDNKDLSQQLQPDEYLQYLRKVYSQIAGRTISDPIASSFNQDIWVARAIAGIFAENMHPGPPINNALPNSVCSLTPLLNSYIVINQFNKDGGMNRGFSTIRRLDDTTWSFPEPVFIDQYDPQQAGVSLTMSSDGKVLILSLQQADTRGDNDLYVCFRLDSTHWSAPRNLGPPVNTTGREITPHLSADGKKLYFASKRSDTQGGTDIYFSERLDDTWLHWSEPLHFQPPINSQADDSQPYFNPTTGYLYFTSRRHGSSDIFRVKMAPEMPDEVLITGSVINSANQEVISCDVLFSAPQDTFFQYYHPATKGTFYIKVPRGSAVKLKASKAGFLGHELLLNTADCHYAAVIDTVLVADPIVANGKISLRPVFFRQSTDTILSSSHPELERLAAIMEEYPRLQIQIAGHTDNQGTEASLLELSEARAEAIRAFLVQRGISRQRMTTIGYGATRPVSDNSTETARQRNRRVEVTITHTGSDSR